MMVVQYVRRQIRQRAEEVKKGGKLGVFADDEVASEVNWLAAHSTFFKFRAGEFCMLPALCPLNPARLAFV